MPPSFWMSSVASSCTTSTMSSTVTMPFMRRSASTTGHRQEVVLREQLADGLLVHVLRNRHHVGVHDVAHALVRLRGEQIAERHHAEQMLLGVEDVEVVDALDVLRASGGAGS